jgi:hypothetical protein
MLAMFRSLRLVTNQQPDDVAREVSVQQRWAEIEALHAARTELPRLNAELKEQVSALDDEENGAY